MMNDKKNEGNKLTKGPLEGIGILDFTLGQHGPIATSMLGDMGADVIHIENNLVGDYGRHLVSIHGKTVEENYYFDNNNRSKRSLKIDLTKPEGKEVIHRLLETHDVFVSNFRESAIKKLEMDYASLKSRCPQLIHAIAYGWGKEGPEAHKPALDLAAQARGGIWSVSGEPGQPPPRIGAGMADQIGGAMLAYGILLAIIARYRTGKGQEVNTSLLGSQAWLGSLGLQAYLYFGFTTPPVARDKGGNPFWNIYQCKDGKWIVLAMLFSDPYWEEFCEATGIKHLLNDEKFKDHVTRTENAVELIQIFDKVFADRNRDEWVRIYEDTDLIWGLVQDYEEVANDPQMTANDYIVDFDHPSHGPVKMVGLPVKLSETPGKIWRPAPGFGEHNQEILLELGYSWDDIEKLVIDGVV